MDYQYLHLIRGEVSPDRLTIFEKPRISLARKFKHDDGPNRVTLNPTKEKLFVIEHVKRAYYNVYGVPLPCMAKRVRKRVVISEGELKVYPLCFVDAAMAVDVDWLVALLEHPEALEYINEEDEGGFTGLHRLCEYNMTELAVRYANIPGCDVLIRTPWGFPSDVAFALGHKECAAVMREIEQSRRKLRVIPGGKDQEEDHHLDTPSP